MKIGVRKFCVSSQRLIVIVPLVTLLVASGIWNIRQQRLIERQRVRALAVEREEGARAAVEAERVAARMKKNAEWAASDARLQQLYREIDTLSRINEKLVAQPVRQPPAPTRSPVDDQGESVP